MDKTHLNDIGVTLQVDFGVDISAATAKAIILEDPDGNESSDKTAEFTTDGTDGKIEYDTVSGDIDQLGKWNFRGKVTLSGGAVYYGVEPTEFEVVN